MGRNGHSCTHRQPRIMARYRSNVFSEGLGRQKGLFRARYSRNVFPNTVFHCFSPLKTYIRSLCCQQHAVRACISATYCHEEAFCRPGLLWEYTITVSCHCLMPSPFMQSIQGGRPASGQRRMRESAWQGGQHRMREGAWRGARADREGVPDWRTTLFNWRHSPFG